MKRAANNSARGPRETAQGLRLAPQGVERRSAFESTEPTPEREAVLDQLAACLARVPTNYLIAWLPAIVGQCAALGFLDGASPDASRLRVVGGEGQ